MPIKSLLSITLIVILKILRVCMQILFSPAKKQQYGKWNPNFPKQTPMFLNEIKELNSYLKSLSMLDIAEIMNISPKLAELNYQRIHSFQDSWQQDHTGPAILSFAGDAYKNLNADSFNTKDLLWANEHLFIISGLYGLLRPLDPIQYYRLEMKTKLPGFSHKNLYDFWGRKLSEKIQEPVVNLASGEYSKAVQLQNVINIDFKEKYNNGYRTVGVKAKRARGSMLNWIITNKISALSDLKDFNQNYVFNENLSDDYNWVYEPIV